ncbi:Low-affinity inorganic phosphate transporter 1 [Pirellula sp. SH-Sr6A]|uniref:inorganic phosphate transporter n=1 Tax=Pirellula sp. SH-Sr6A TaxID=1632865 RepID=UPI00078B53F8|nr:inorganic phosphate transporter [Pirellula sp. SH-Sr6A]AMV31425.1 Low-affinity inorganic phosphate transporter 1 [Pirellula sp. SH-Sr6A]
MLTGSLVAAVLFVAFTNGANANFKGVASLYGSGLTTRRTALLWGTMTTWLGCIAAAFFARGLLAQFSGKGVVPNELVASPVFALAVALGGAVTSFLATRIGFPVSTTHALVGALAGAGLAAAPADVAWGPLAWSFLIPLLFSPIMAMAMGYLACRILARTGSLTTLPSRWNNRLHFLSAGAASFARGMNDAPKMAALFMLLPDFSPIVAILLVSVAMAAGGLLDSKNVAETLGKKLTAMEVNDGLVASLTTACLVISASYHSLPVSTTHVSVGSLAGIGVANNRLHRRKMVEIAMAWICTVPCGATLAAIAYTVASRLVLVAT